MICILFALLLIFVHSDIDLIGNSAINIYKDLSLDKWCRYKYKGNENIYKEKKIQIKNTVFEGMCIYDMKLFDYNSTYKCPLEEDCFYDICMTEGLDKVFNINPTYNTIQGFINTRGFVRLYPGRYSNTPEYHFNTLGMKWFNRALYGQYTHYYILDNLQSFDEEYDKILKIRKNTHDTINIIRIIGEISFTIDSARVHRLLFMNGGMSVVIDYINQNNSADCIGEDLLITVLSSNDNYKFSNNKKKIFIFKSTDIIDSFIDLDLYNNRDKIYIDKDTDGLWDAYFKNKIWIRSKRVYDNKKLLGLSFIMNLNSVIHNQCVNQNTTTVIPGDAIYNETLNTTIIYMNKTTEHNSTIFIFYPIFNNTDICCSPEIIEEIIIIVSSVITTVVLVIIAIISSYCCLKKKYNEPASNNETELTYSI